MTLGDIGEDNSALLCITDQTTCCRPSDTGDMVGGLGNWYLPNGSKVPSEENQVGVYGNVGQPEK